MFALDVTFLFVAAALTVVSAKLDPSLMSPELKELAANLQKQCIAESHVEKGLVLKAIEGEITNDEKLKCYFLCLLKATKTLKEDGSLDYTSIKKILPESYYDRLDRMVEKCGKPVKNGQTCERANDFVTCYNKSAPDVFIMF